MMKAGDKYIIEIEEVIGSDSSPLAKIKGFNSLVFDKNGLDKLVKLDGLLKEQYYRGYMQGFQISDRMANKKELPFNIGDVIVAEIISNSSNVIKTVGFYNGKFKDKYYICVVDSEIGKTNEDGTPMGSYIYNVANMKKMIEEPDNEQ